MSQRAQLNEFVERSRSVFRVAELDEAAAEVIGAFESAQVECLLLKGPALARMLYSADETRGYSDIDLLVPGSKLPKARRSLAGLGYRNSADMLAVDVAAAIPHSETWSRRARTGKGGPVVVDLHWRLAGCEAPSDVTWEALARRRIRIELHGRDASILDLEGLALHLAIHAAQHGPGDLKAMADLERGVERWPADVWRGSAVLAREIDGMPAFGAGLRLLPAGSRLAGELGLPPTDELSRAILRRGARPPGAFHMEAFAQARGLSERVKRLNRALLPTREWIVRQYPWAGSGGARMAVARSMHLLRAPAWAARAWWYRRRQRRAGAGAL